MWTHSKPVLLHLHKQLMHLPYWFLKKYRYYPRSCCCFHLLQDPVFKNSGLSWFPCWIFTNMLAEPRAGLNSLSFQSCSPPFSGDFLAYSFLNLQADKPSTHCMRMESTSPAVKVQKKRELKTASADNYKTQWRNAARCRQDRAEHVTSILKWCALARNLTEFIKETGFSSWLWVYKIQ